MSEEPITASTKQKPGQLARRSGRLFRLLASVSALLVIGTYLLIYYAPLPNAPAPRQQLESTKIYDRDGRMLYDSAGPADAHFTQVPLSQLPLSLRQAVIATEDSSFYKHPGIDPSAIARAGLDDILHLRVRSGGSTITQQLARNLYMDQEERTSANPVRKLKEAALALRLERTRTKDEILESYLNRAYFGNLAYGIEAASQTYFGKGARDLDLAESSFLAGMLQGPSLYDPFTHLEAAKARQHIVLGLMVDKGYLTTSAASAAAAEPLAITRTPFPIQAPHFVAWVLQQLPDLVGDEALAGGDLRIYTSLDLSLQTAAQTALQDQIVALHDKNVGSGAVVALDPATGQVLAMVGSADYFDASHGGAVNAALAERQPGSAIKPIVYATALEQGFSPASPLLDVPTSFSTRHGEVYSPQNYDLTFHGVVPLREALASSYNVPAVRLLQSAGIDNVVHLGRQMGLSSFRNPDDYDLSLTLGGGEVRLLDLTSAYGAFATGGLRADPVTVLSIETSSGKKVYEAPAGRQRPRILSADTAFLISDILSDNDARAPGFGLYSPLRLSRPAAVKTGTTTDFRDNWTVGYTPDLVVGVWTGNPDGSPMRNVSGVDGAAPVWREVMTAGLRNKPARDFERPAGIEQVRVCLPSGLLPTPECQRTRIEVFAAGNAPTRQDDYYRRLDCTSASDGPCDYRVYAFVPLEAIPWARQAGLDLPPLLPYSVTASLVGGRALSSVAGQSAPDQPRLRLVSPADGLVLSLSREVRLSDQVIPIEVLPTAPVRYVEFLVDGQPIGRVENAPFRQSWQLRAGSFRIEARAVTVSGQEIWSPIARLQVLAP